VKSYAISLLMLFIVTSSGCLDDPAPVKADASDSAGVADTPPDGEDANDVDSALPDSAPEVDTTLADGTEDSSAPDVDEPDTMPETAGDTLAEVVDSADTSDVTDSGEPDVSDVADTSDGEVTPASPLALVLTEEASGWTIANARLLVALGADTGWLPRDLRGPSGGGGTHENLLYGRASGPTHTHEEWVGLSLFDFAHLWSELTTPSRRAVGPAVVQTFKDWSYTGFMNGSTLMTVHADGRIVLSYEVSVPSSRAATLVSYAALDITRFTHVRSGSALLFDLPSGDTAAGGIRFLGGSNLIESDYLCASNISSGDVVGFVAHPIEALNPLLARITENAFGAQDPHSIRLQYDLARETVSARSYAARLLLTVDGSGLCANAAALAAAFREPPSFEVSEGIAITDQQGDVDHDGFLETIGAYIFAAPAGVLSLTPRGPLPSVTLRIIAANWATPVITVDDSALVEGVDFLAQPADGGSSGWITIVRPLIAGAALSIDW